MFHSWHQSVCQQLFWDWEKLKFKAKLILSLGQTDRQVVASGRKFNLRKDLRWVAKRLASFFASTRKSQKKTF